MEYTGWNRPSLLTYGRRPVFLIILGAAAMEARIARDLGPCLDLFIKTGFLSIAHKN
jgi:hypothetical protein